MKRISLIANSSIQYYKFSEEINLDFGKNTKLYFHQPFDNNLLDFIYNPVLKTIINEEEVFFSKQELNDKGFLIGKTNKIKDDVNLDSCVKIPEVEIYSISNLKTALRKFQKKWIPLPYFKNNNINKDLIYPTDWVRVYFECNDTFSKIDITVSIDTSLAKNESDKTSPQLSLNYDENIYTLSTDENLISGLIHSQETSNKWIDSYLADLFYGKNEELRYEQPLKQYIAYYMLLVNWFSSLKNNPEIQLYTDDAKKIPVDLVIDIGNSSTCALLFENQNDSIFKFDKVKKLIIQDFSNPLKEYDKPFPMNLLFKEAIFGKSKNDMYYNSKFVVPSMVRVGFEAEELINHYSINLEYGREINSYNSSPKRYLWDDKASEFEWEFSPDEDKKLKKVHLNGISEQLKSDGSLTGKGEVFGSKSQFSRSSLMKFVFLELLTHAYVQINSYKFREEHGNLTTPRSLRRITISCPTAMIQHEQIALRQAAKEACKLLNNYFSLYYNSSTEKSWFDMPEIIPSIEDLKKDLTQLEEKKDWNYDEATSCQLVFLYSLLSKKLQGNQYVLKNYVYKNKKNITIGSIDIGAGTTDIMIANYQLNAESKSVELKPDPLYWDSFKIAGDDLIKELIQKIIIQGKIENTLDEGCSGVIQNHAISIGIQDIESKLNGFFGQDSNQIGFVGKLMRKAFINQVAIPIITHYLNLANEKNIETKSFEEIIGEEFKNTELIKYFEKHFGFNFLNIKWVIQPKKVEQILNSVFDGIVKQLSITLNHYKCDYVVLSGKPVGLNSLEAIFSKYLNIPTNNLINLNHYWIGKWFPFSDSRGFVEDPKTMVAVGSMISLMSNRLKKIDDLKFDTELIKQKLISTADYIVKKSFDSHQIILSPTNNESTIMVRNLPYSFGYSKFKIKDYPISDLYNISINNDEIIKSCSGKVEESERRRLKIDQSLPLEFTVSREYDLSKEKLKIESVQDSEGNEYPPKFFKLNYQTLGDQQEYWLDNCEFTLGI